jgi:hypothetical protein
MNSSADALSPVATTAPAVAPRPSQERRLGPVRIPLRDRAWMPYHTVRAIGPVRTPSTDQVRELLIMLRQTDPRHPLVCRIDERTAVQQPVSADQLDDYLASVIVFAPAGADAVELARLLQARPLDGLPFMIAISDRAAAMRSAHVIGDTATANPWFFGLLRAADPERALGLITSGRSTRFPLAAALINQFGRDPRRGIRALRRALPLGPATGSAGSPVAATVGIPELITRTATPDVEAALRTWRADHAPKASVAALWMAASVRALRLHGIDTGDGVFTMMNCRRYLPEGAAVQGNFAVGPYLLPDDLADPNALGTELAGAAADGVPLVLLTAIAARSVLRRGRPAQMPTMATPGSAPKINLSYFGGISADDVDFVASDDLDGLRHGQYVVAAEPAGPNAVTYVFARSPYGMHLSATAHPEFTDVAALDAALQSVATDPVGLLDGTV